MEKLSEKPEMDCKPINQTPAALLLVALITSNMRALKSLSAKFVCGAIYTKKKSLENSHLKGDRI